LTDVETKPGTAPGRGFLAAWRELGLAAPLAVGVTILPPVGGLVLLALIPWIAPYLPLYPVAGSVGFVLLSAVLIGLALVPTVSISILAGWAFGHLWGFSLTMVALTIAGWLAYGAAGLVTQHRVLDVVRARPGWNAVYHSLLGRSTLRTAFVIFLLRLPPLAPMATGNYLLGALRVPMRIYLPATIAGLAPRTFTLAFAAAELQQLTFDDVEHPTVRIVGILVSIASLAALTLLGRHALRQAVREPTPAESSVRTDS
jgi:uncharacterized membrane protein YdjX (TVP38/TMEM64 family)